MKMTEALSKHYEGKHAKHRFCNMARKRHAALLLNLPFM